MTTIPERFLSSISVSGFRSIANISDLELQPLNILIGPNGAGKSNLIAFFRMLNWMTGGSGNLQLHIGSVGGANTILHEGASVTPQIETTLKFKTPEGTNEYFMRLFYAAGDTLIFADEAVRFLPDGAVPPFLWHSFGGGHKESCLTSASHKTAQFILQLLRHCVVYQFHNTSATARIRQSWQVEDNRFLKEDGANLASILYKIKTTNLECYERIQRYIRLVAPFFSEFVLAPSGLNESVIMLRWREVGSDYEFAAQHASDGTLRCMALITLLLQPVQDISDVLILDEPELGLHPKAISTVGGLILSLSSHKQIILATQSETLLNVFRPEDVIVVERDGRVTTTRRLEPSKLAEWINEYSLSELWDKNVIGGRPK